MMPAASDVAQKANEGGGGWDRCLSYTDPALTLSQTQR